MKVVSLNISHADLKTVESCLREYFAVARYENIEIDKIQAVLSIQQRFETIKIFVKGPGSKYCFNKGDYHTDELVYFETSRQDPMLFVQRCRSSHVYVCQGHNRCCNTFHSGKDVNKCGQLTKRASHILWNANPLPYVPDLLLRSAKAILYELRNKVTLQFNPAEFDRLQDCLRENFDDARYRNITIDSIEGTRSPRTNVIDPIIFRVKGPAYCNNVGDRHDGVYFEITAVDSERPWFQQCCINTSSISRGGETIHCELFKSGHSLKKTGKLTKRVLEILRNPLSVTSDCSDECQDPVHGVRWNRTSGKRLCMGRDNKCIKIARGEKYLCVGCGGGDKCKSQGCPSGAQHNHEGYCRKHFRLLYSS